MRNTTKLFVIFLLAASAIPAMAQTPLMKHYNLFRGKEEYKVNVIYQEPKGWLWFGTDRGLFRYDGINYTRFSRGEGLGSDTITALYSSSDEILWIGHIDGKISLFNGETFDLFRPEAGLGKVKVTDIVSDSSGVIWYSTDGEGIFRWDGKYLSNINTDEGLSSDAVIDIETDTQGLIWLATDLGITLYSNGKCEIISEKNGLVDNDVRVLKRAADGKLWIGTGDHGLAVYNTESRTFLNIAGWSSGPVTGLSISKGNDIWVSSEKNDIFQVKISDNSEPVYRKIGIARGPISVRINSLIKDLEENIWFGGDRFVTQILPPVFEFLDSSDGLPFEVISSLLTDRSGNIWVSSEKGLYMGIRNSTGSVSWENLSRKMNLEKTNFSSLTIDNEKMVWAGTYGEGVYRIDPQGLMYKKYTSLDGLSNDNVISISQNKNHLWFSTLGGGVSCFDTETRKFVKCKDQEMNEAYVYSTISDINGRTWIASSLRYPSYILDNKLYQVTSSGQKVPQLYSVATDTSGGVWFNTADKGIIRLTGDSMQVIGINEGIGFKKIESIVFDKLNNLVVISNNGILFYKPGKGVFLEFGENSDLAYRYPEPNAVFTDNNGQIWIGTNTGIIKYNPDYLQFAGNNPHIFLSVRKQDYNPISRRKRKFRYNENNFTFGYTGIWFTNPEGLKYRYMLKGNERDWNTYNRNQTRTYSNLAPGEYSFIAEVSLDEKNWHGSAESEFSFKIYPPFWRRWWFITGLIILAGFAIYSYIRLRLVKLEKDKERLEEEVHKRTEEIRNQNVVLAEQKKEIEVQRDLAEGQRDKIEAQKEEIQASIRYAQRIQSATLPPKKQIDNILGDHFILNKPCDIVSGDFYWVASRGSHNFFAAVDCTGHGVPGAFMSMLGMSSLNDIVKSLSVCTAAAVLHHLRDRIQESLHQGGDRETVSHDGMDISLCILDKNTNKLQFSAARNPMYIIRNGEITVILADKIDIGYLPVEKLDFTNHEFQCEPGDQIYLFTDGFADQFGGPNGKKYKYQQFKDFLVSIHSETMENQAIMLDKEIEDWRGSRHQIDDILIMGIRISNKGLID